MLKNLVDWINPYKKYFMIGAAIAVVIALGFSHHKAYTWGQDAKQAEWDKAEKARDDAERKQQQADQAKADAIDEDTNKIIQDLSVKNAALQRELDDEKIKPDYDCVLPSSGVQQYRKNVSAPKG